MSVDLLGRVEDYVVMATGPTPETISTSLRWSSIKWDRALASPSSATVVCPLADIVDWRGVILKDWSHGIALWRNGVRIWWGPIRKVNNPPGSDTVTITAIDAMGLTAKRELNQDAEIVDADISAAFNFLLDEAGDLRGLGRQDFHGGITVARNYQVADYSSIEQHINEFDRMIQWTVVDHQLHVTTEANRPIYGTFTDAAFVERPGFTLDGDERANEVVIPGGTNGEAGFARAWRARTDPGPEGRMTRFVSSSFYRPVEGLDYDWDPFFSSMARQMLEAWSNLPIIVQGSQLSPEAPVDINNLVPGTAWDLAIMQDELPWLSTQQILESVEVSVDADEGLTEVITPTLIPPTELYLAI